MNKKIPTFKTDEEAISFLEQNDLSDYITSENFVPAKVIFNQPKGKDIAES